MVRIRTASSERGRWAAAGLLGLGLLAALLLWRASHGLSGGAFGALSQAQSSLRNTLLGSTAVNGGGGGGTSGGSNSSGSSAASSSGRPSKQASAKVSTGGRTPRKAYPPLAQPDAAFVKERCGAATGDWCGRYHAQQPFPAEPPPTPNITCLWGCNFVGVCDASTGWCRCPAGWQGVDCSTRMKRPCSQRLRDHGFEPFDEPTNPAFGGGTFACADQCDYDTAHCYCNATFAHGRIPADPHEPPGTPPKRYGRPMGHTCRRDTDWEGKKGDFGNVPTALLYGDKGWCQADEPEFRCPCLLDGWGGPFCETPYEPTCVNQCNGHGECLSGFCKCHDGWFGSDCANRRAGVPWTPGMEDGERPWLKPHVHTPAARDPTPGETRKRPLIYVYDLPAIYNSIFLQYREDKGQCTHRLFAEDNSSTIFTDSWGYLIETGLHEMLLQSEHRTLDPEVADYFYIPAYSSCVIYPILWAADFPHFHGGPAAGRVPGSVNMLMEVHHYISTRLPYWNRNGGRDHIIVQSHDEGSCWLPAVLRPAIVLSHWGRTEIPEKSDTGYWPDDFLKEFSHPVYQPEGQVWKLGKFPCYDPKKDMVIPVMYSPNKYHASPFLGAPARERKYLAVFKGRTQQGNAPYSRGIRQTLQNLTRDEGWWEKHKIWIGETNPPGVEASYSELLASSVFFFSLMGDGFSSRYDDAIIHGCIPVMVHDGVEPSWSSLLDTESYSVRVLQKDMPRIPEILKAIPQSDIDRMRANIARVWRRHIWTGYRPYGEVVRGFLKQHREQQPAQQEAGQAQEGSSGGGSGSANGPRLEGGLPLDPDAYDPNHDDALSTLMQWLYSRVDDLGAHAPERRRARAALRKQ